MDKGMQMDTTILGEIIIWVVPKIRVPFWYLEVSIESTTKRGT